MVVKTGKISKRRNRAVDVYTIEEIQKLKLLLNNHYSSLWIYHLVGNCPGYTVISMALICHQKY
jgi:hypothetical protein